MHRNQQWLEERLDSLLKKYFADLPIITPIEISAVRLGTEPLVLHANGAPLIFLFDSNEK